MFEILLGMFTHPILNYYVAIQLGIFVIFMVVAWLLYPKKNRYSILRCTMSFLGSPDDVRNPQGWYFFSIAVVWKMLTDIPLMMYFFRFLSKHSIFAAYVSILFYGIGIISGIIVGFFPDTEKNETSGNFFKDLRLGMVHNVAAVLSFGAMFIANFTVSIFYLVHPYTRLLSDWLPPLLIFVAAVAGGFFTQIKWQMKLKKNKTLSPWPGKGWYSLPLWEWTLFIVAEGFIYWNILII